MKLQVFLSGENGYAQAIADELAEMFHCKCDQIPPAYQCDREKLVFLVYEKYGKLDKRFDRNYQALYSYKLTFCFTTDAGSLENLNGKSFQVEKVDFVEEYFPGFTIPKEK